MTQQTLFAVQNQDLVMGIPKSLFVAVQQDPDRWCKILKGNIYIKDFETYEQQYRRFYGRNPRFSHISYYFLYDLNKTLLKLMFYSATIRNTIITNVGVEQANKVYTQIEPISVPIFVAPKPSQVIITRQKVLIDVPSYNRGNRIVRAYKKERPYKLAHPQRKFILERKLKGMKPSQVIREYLSHFKDGRSPISIRNHYYRIKN